ncbi:MAG: S8 family serine peptidase [Anaerolineae bacterium]|nr:S8 family serine peptidase [Chloroflexota bacterium]
MAHRPLPVVRLLALLLVLLSPIWGALPPARAQQPVPAERPTGPVRAQPPLLELPEALRQPLPPEALAARLGYLPHALERALDPELPVIVQLEAPALSQAMLHQRDRGGALDPAAAEAYRAELARAQDALLASAARLGVRPISRYDMVFNGLQLRVRASQLPALAALPGVARLWRAAQYRPTLASSVPIIGADTLASDYGLDGSGLVIGIIDTGIDYTHGALGGSGGPGDYAANNPATVEPGSFPTARVIGGWDLAGSDYDAGSNDPALNTPHPDPDPLDEQGHGTHVASIAAGQAYGTVARGVAPGASLMAYKVFGSGGSSTLIMDAIEMATESYLAQGYPQVLNLSLGAPWGVASADNPDVVATEAAVAAGLVVVAAAGNDGDASYVLSSPGVARGAITVAASHSQSGTTGTSDTAAWFTSRGPAGADSWLKPDVSAPGQWINAADMGSGSGATVMSGTSMATPHVAGLAALILQQRPQLTPAQVKAALINTAKPLDDGSPLSLAGTGRVEGIAAVTTTLLALGDPELVSISPGVLRSREASLTTSASVTLFNLGDAALDTSLSSALLGGTPGVGHSVSPTQLTLAPHSSAQATLTITLDMAALSETLSPQLEEIQGLVLATGSDGQTARVPWYLHAKPYTTLTITGDSAIVQPDPGLANLQVTTSGAVPSELWAWPALQISHAPDPTVSPAVSPRMLGMDYVALEQQTADHIGVAIEAWGPWHDPQPEVAEFDLYLDTNNDGVDDYVAFNAWLGMLDGTEPSNDWAVALVNLATNETTFPSSYAIYTDLNHGLMEWFLPVSALGLSRTQGTFGYQLLGWDSLRGTWATLPPGTTNYWDAPLYWSADRLDPGPGAPTAQFSVSAGSAEAWNRAMPLGLMITDQRGDPRHVDGAQAWLAPLRRRYAFRVLLPVVIREP